MLGLKNWSVRRLFSLMPPRILSIGISEIKNLGLGFFATTIGGLSFVVIRLGLRLMTIPIRLFGVPISQASLPFLSQETEDEKQKRFGSLVVQSLHQISFFALPASVLLLILRIPVVRLVFGADNFPWKSTVLTGKVVAILAISVAAQAMVQLLIRAFYALKNTKVPFFITLTTVILYFVVSGIFVYFTDFGVLGLAWATTVSAYLELILFIFALHAETKCFTTKTFWWPQLKMLVSGFLMAVFLYLPFRILDEVVFDTSRTLELIALTFSTGTIGMLVYIYFSYLFDVKELGYLTKIFSAVSKWRPLLANSKEILVDTVADGSDV